MSQPDHQLLIQSKPYLFAATLSGILLLVSFISGQFGLALFTSILCLSMFLNILKSNKSDDTEQNIKWLKYSSLALATATFFGVKLGVETVNTWLYFIPLLIFFFYEFKPALWIVGLFSVFILMELDSQDNAFENIQVSLNYLLYLGISGSLVYLREVSRRQLKPLRRTDSLTMAASREHLDNDLGKEVQRSEREGSDLATMALGVDKNCLSKLSPQDQDTVIINIGKLLHNNLRLFDSYYLWDKHEFFVVLPHTSSSQAVKIANTLRVQIRKSISIADESITISIGVSGLNVGDDSQDLIYRASQALKETHAKSRNRTQLYSEDNEGEGSKGKRSDAASDLPGRSAQ